MRFLAVLQEAYAPRSALPLSLAGKVTPTAGLEVEEEVDTGCCSACCTVLLVILSIVLMILFFPFSLLLMIKVGFPPLPHFSTPPPPLPHKSVCPLNTAGSAAVREGSDIPAGEDQGGKGTGPRWVYI